MNEPKNHHLVPRCYLKNFGVARFKSGKPQYFVDVYDKNQKDKGVFRNNIKNTCVEKDFYTFKGLSEDQKLFLENFFAKTIECYYGPIYKKLVSNDALKLSKTERCILIDFCLHQFFRTSKITNNFNQFWTNVLERGHSMMKAGSPFQQIEIEGERIIDFTGKTLDEVTKDEHQRNRERINIENFQHARRLSALRKNDYVSVDRLDEGHDFITSDNPCFMDGHPLDPETIIRMPINTKFMITIIPGSQADPDLPRYGRSTMPPAMSEITMIQNNIYQIEKSERTILGREADITQALQAIETFDVDAYIARVVKITEAMQKTISVLESMKVAKSK